MKRIFYPVLIILAFAIDINAQVTIGSLKAPQKGVVLELKSDSLGFLLTRVNLDSLVQHGNFPNVAGMIVYNSTATANFKTGFYVNTGTGWTKLTTSPFQQYWFYMPSIALDVSKIGTPVNVDLYAAFTKQFNTPVSVSTGAPTAVSAPLPAAGDLYYYVTGCDTAVFSNISITNAGMMTYTTKAAPSDSTYMNIVFVEK